MPYKPALFPTRDILRSLHPADANNHKVRVSAAVNAFDVLIASHYAYDEANRRVYYPGWSIEKYRERMAYYREEYDKAFASEPNRPGDVNNG